MAHITQGVCMRRFDVESSFHFPYATFASAAAFHDFVASSQEALNTRYAYEVSLARAAVENIHVSPGTCGICLDQTRFSTVIPDAAPHTPVPEPNWREQQVCACAQQLNARFRAMLQVIDTESGLLPWMRVLVLGASQAIEPHIRAQVAAITARLRSGRGVALPQAEAASYHLIVSSEHLHAEPMLQAVLEGMRTALRPGGKLVFTAPFDVGAADSRPDRPGAPGVLGWDILDRIQRAGFESAAAHLFWSEEFGYLGPFNLIFSASA
jgi:hypothetical protein